MKDVLFPRKCLGCGEWGKYICADCVNFVRSSDSRICPVCGKLSFGGLTHPVCCKPFSLSGLTSVFSYEGIIKKAILKLKFRFVTDLSETLLELFLSFIGSDDAFINFVGKNEVILAPIPLYKKRENWRGFNQSELLGREIAGSLGIRFLPDLLKKTKDTIPQVNLRKDKRSKNMFGAFRINNEVKSLALRKPVVLFDDVWTTGATLKEGAKVLRRNGVGKVWGLTLARVERKVGSSK